ncbi:hypothetical protein ASPBRDRAFT_501942 [Aspergillus brasiliensis CBS 101740]|uniref:Uncharacterized protein n=1 Tax=Aspergillus brasiliensis (strain CBS 101740 / IMI 381727 / IBT 21946) TaxID=767769 RepID=A0A1L9UNZ9_ASPBC|nr:hypothetical protein ASPBRDRAFT_501942 [Aspergillus brasiliensis CBS 101740]
MGPQSPPSNSRQLSISKQRVLVYRVLLAQGCEALQDTQVLLAIEWDGHVIISTRSGWWLRTMGRGGPSVR